MTTTQRPPSFGFLLTDVTRLMRQAFQCHLKYSGLTLASARALLYISRNEGLRQVDLAEKLEIKPITLARLIDQLASNGMVERRVDANDRRAFLLFITEAAAPHLEQIDTAIEAVRTTAMQGMSKDDQDTLLRLLSLLHSNLGAH